MTGTCYIVGAGVFSGSFTRAPGDCVIAADGGYHHLQRLGILPDLLLGDFDSFTGELPPGVSTKRYPAEKDDTDMMICAKAGLALGFTKFVLLGATGGRPDHTIANVQLLRYIAGEGASGEIRGGGSVFAAFERGQLKLPLRRGGYVSVFALDNEARGVTLVGLRYPLDRATLTNRFSRGVSNEFTGKPARVSVEEGALLVVYDELQCYE